MKKALLILLSGIYFANADTFLISKFVNGKFIESSVVEKTTNFASIYDIDYDIPNETIVKMNGQIYTIPRNNSNKLEINSNDKTLNLLVYNLNGDMVEDKALNQFIPWGSNRKITIEMEPMHCYENCTNMKFIVEKE